MPATQLAALAATLLAEKPGPPAEFRGQTPKTDFGEASAGAAGG